MTSTKHSTSLSRPIARLTLALALAVCVAGLLLLASASRAATWSSPITVSTSGEQAYPFSRTVAMDANGDTMVAWLRVTSSTLGSWQCPCTVRAAYRPAGGAFGAPVNVSPTIANPDAALAIHLVMDASGDAIVAWNAPANPSDPGADVDTAYAAIRPAGGSFGAPATLASGDAEVDSLAIDAAGDAVAGITGEQTYTGAGTAPGGNVLAAEVIHRPAGAAFDTAHPQFLSDGVHDAYVRDVAMSPNGKAVVEIRSDLIDYSHPTASEPNSVQVAVSGAPGAPFGSPTTLQTVTQPLSGYPLVDASPHQVAIDDAGDYVAAYEYWEDASTTHAKASLNGGSAVTLSGTDGSATSGPVVMGPDGKTIALWSSYDQDGNVFEHENTRPAGGAFGSAVTLASDLQPPAAFVNATNAEGADGSVLYAFEGFDADGNVFDMASIGATAGSFPAPTTLSPANDDPFAFGLDGAIDKLGDAAEAWTDSNFAVRAAVTGTVTAGSGNGPAGPGTGTGAAPNTGGASSNHARDQIRSLRLTPRTIRKGKRFVFQVKLAAPARITISILRRIAAKGHGKHRKKAHWVSVGKLKFKGKAGLNKLSVKKVHRHVLAPGSYEAKVTAGGKAHVVKFKVRR